MSPQNSRLAYIVVSVQSLLAVICVCAICAAMFYKNYSDPATLSALFLLTGTLVGNLGSILGGPRSMMPAKESIPVTVENPTSDPIPVIAKPEEKPQSESKL